MDKEYLYREHHMDIADVTKKLHEVKADQLEIDIIVDAFEQTINPLHVFNYLFQYYDRPEQISHEEVNNLYLKYLFCLTGTEYYPLIAVCVYVWLSFSKEQKFRALFLNRYLVENGKPSDPEEAYRILLRGIDEYLEKSKTGISTN
ncbi:MAG: hypothetical protein GXY77_06690 [Fibrobacter sp.]|nr:hypothetical protein [Fibrobacter sp.]